MEPIPTNLDGWLSLAVTVLGLVCTGLVGLIFKVKADAQRENDALSSRLAEQRDRIEAVEDQVGAWQLEIVRQHPTKQDLKDMENRIIERVNVLIKGA